jgi:hypothetical protein
MSALAAANRLRAELEELSRVLAAGDGGSLVAMEERLASAIDALSKDAQIDAPDRIAVAGALLGARTALGRCRILGRGISDLAQATMVARGQHANYDHAGLAAARNDVRGVSVDARF